ncbi:MAG TPA: cytochrome C [Burkholderiales bacterium]|nr:cytochrome C [Burkholderiales bacterium]
MKTNGLDRAFSLGVYIQSLSSLFIKGEISAPRLIIRKLNLGRLFVGLAALMVALLSGNAQAVPAFARQTGQNCLACHAGGNFPELTPYGRLFKLTGYTIGKRTIPLAVMGVFGSTNVKGPTPTGPGHTATDGSLTFDTGSLFVAGKITDKSGVFAQFTYNNYSGDTGASGQVGSDNTDFRYADQLINGDQNFIYGFDVNNNPGVEDVWNSTPAWGYNVVPISTGFGPASLPIIDQGLAQQAIGTGAYLYWNKTVYAEISGYRTGDGVYSFMTQGNGQQINIKGENPYLRLALTHDWGAQNIMLGYSYFDVDEYVPGMQNLTNHYRDNTIDFQYQYLLDPHTFTVEMTRTNETVNYGDAGAVPDTINSMMAKATYTYEAKYGAALSYFNISNSSNNISNANPNYNPGAIAGEFGSQTGTEGWTPEVFWLPVQNVRIGVQYTMFNRVDGVATGAADSFNGKASGDNQVVFYVWGAY